jgi:NAD+ diphosphatase
MPTEGAWADWIHCPRCTSRLRLEGELGNRCVRCPTCEFTKWDNPLPTTIAVIRDARRVLLMRRCQEPQAGRWDAVGGFLTAAETAEQCVQREAEEEIGVRVEVGRFLGTYLSTYGNAGPTTIGLAFECTLPEGANIQLSEENSEYGWFDLDNLPEIAFDDVRDVLTAVRG